ncbi:MAG TPA: alanine racemase, partial [Pirellulales bacterium]|nr:alanine racemase [Pirellulales bacterium]
MPKVKPERRDGARVTTVAATEPPIPSSRYPGRGRQHHIQVVVSRPTFYENILYLRKAIAPSKICVVLKSNAYGHGLAPLVPVAVAAGADYLGVCSNPEARAVRALGFDVPLFRLRMGLPEELVEAAAELDMEEEVGTWEQAEFLSALGRKRRRKIAVHINVDTGMGRSGFFSEQVGVMRKVCGLAGLRIRGVFTHFPKSDGADLEPTGKSLDAFDHVCKQLSNVLPDDVLFHTHNSAATVRLAERRRHLV